MFFGFGIKDAVDIFLVALMLYYIYKLMKESRSLNAFIGIMVFILVWLFVSQVLEMRLLGSILDKLVSVGVIGLIVLFKDEIRKFLCMDMSRGKVGALIVIERGIPLDDIVQTGEKINANVNKLLIENIFFKNSPLHDGAMIISKRRIKAAGCILPVSHSMDIPKELGLRHRAAMGMSQASDAIIIVVSEETGGISIAMRGEFRLRLSAEELEGILAKEMPN